MDNRTKIAAEPPAALSPVKRRLLERLTGGGRSPGAAALEDTLAGIWSRVLGYEPCGLDDDFFRAGGDSILAIRLRNLVCEELGVALEIQQIYDHPTIRGLLPIVRSLRSGCGDAPGAVARDAGQDEGRPGIDLPDGVVDAYPMSEMQKAMAFHAELRRSEHSYINHGEAAIEGRWSLPAFVAALDGLIRRHEILRTRFDFLSYREPMQLVQRPRRLTVPLVDVAGAVPDVSAAMRQVRASMLRRPFRLDDSPLVRVVIVRERDSRHYVAHAHHHAILDGWSLNLLFRDVWVDYGRALGGLPAREPAVQTQYRDFVRAERDALYSEATREYWRAKVEGIPRRRVAAAAGPERPQPGVERESADAVGGVSVRIPSGIARTLERIADAERVHLSTVLLAGHGVCIGALHGLERVATGRVVNGRLETAGGDEAVGLFVNTCLHVADLGPGTWLDLVRRTAVEERATHTHRRFPISRMQEVLGPGEPVETLFVFEHYHMHAGGPPVAGLRVTGRDYAANNVTLVASFVWSPDRSRLDLTLYGLRRAVPEWLLHRTAGWYLQVLGAIARAPEAPYRPDAVFTRAQVHQQAVEWNDTAAPLPDTTLPADFARWAARAPASPALFAGATALTYGDLDRRARRVARFLSATIAPTAAPVGVLLEPGEEQVVAVVAVVVAGFAYLPLDASDPPERIRRALAEVGAPAVLTHSSLVGRFDFGAARALAVDHLEAALPRETSGDPVVSIAGGSPLYVIFTSGSTGVPKAVRLDHRGRANNFHDFIRRFGIGPGDRLLGVSSLTFDMSAFDILGTLAAGAALVAPTSREKKDPQAWLRLISTYGVTVWHSAPAMLRMLLDALPDGTAERLQTLRLALLGGDWIPMELPGRLKRLVPHVEIVSLGGATEVSMDSTIHRLAGPAYPIPTIPYGRPMANQKAFVLGPRLEPSPAGVAGELYLGGVGVGDGYVNRPDLTACRFLPNPYAAAPGERVYKTGDHARHLPDGMLELLGRRDFQVKINGFRIEPAEIEQTLAGYRGVQQVVVAAKAGADGQRRLVAYLVLDRPAAGAGALVPEIRGFLRSRLPAYMQPSSYVLLDALPLTPNGKVNRLALPEPLAEAPGRRPIVEPRDARERAVLEAWRGVLRREAIGVEDDFFESGGDSIVATQIVSRLRAEFGVDISLAVVFDHPTVAEQARRIAELTARAPAAEARAR